MWSHEGGLNANNYALYNIMEGLQRYIAVFLSTRHTYSA